MRTVALVLSLWLAGCGVSGDPVTGPVGDLTFVAEAEDVAFATGSGKSLRGVRVRPFVADGALHLWISTLFELGSGAADALAAEGELQIATGGKLYRARAVRLETPEAIGAVLPVLLREGFDAEAAHVRWDPAPERYPGTQLRQWFFRVEG